MKYRCTLSATFTIPRWRPGQRRGARHAFEDLPGEWVCPDCGAGKEDFEPIED